MSKRKATGLVMMVAVLAAGAAIAWGQSRTQDVEVGIAARSVPDGRIELAIEYDGERVLPNRRYLTAQQINARNGSWLRSTPATIQVQIAPSAGASDDSLSESQTMAATDDNRVSASRLERATYLTESTVSGVATLVNGEFREPAAPGSSAELVIQLGRWAAGDLDGQGGEDAAAITVERPGGSGTFYFIHALTAGEDGLRDVGAVFLGDRIRIEEVAIHGGAITVRLLDRAPSAAMSSEPDVAMLRRFAIEGGALVELDDGRVSAADLERATYLTENTDAGVATLEGGEFRAPAAPGSSAELVLRLGKWAAGDLDGRGGEDAAAITVELPGGTGRFYLVHGLVAGEDGLRDVGALPLGDRIRVEAVAIHDGVITVALLGRAPDAAMSSEPNVAVIRRFALEDGALVELDDGRVSAAELEQATYLTENTDTGVATLEGGEFREPVAAGSSSELVIRLGKWAAGDLDGRAAKMRRRSLSRIPVAPARSTSCTRWWPRKKVCAMPGWLPWATVSAWRASQFTAA